MAYMVGRDGKMRLNAQVQQDLIVLSIFVCLHGFERVTHICVGKIVFCSLTVCTICDDFFFQPIIFVFLGRLQQYPL
jgi:hypothetical protein